MENEPINKETIEQRIAEQINESFFQNYINGKLNLPPEYGTPSGFRILNVEKKEIICDYLKNELEINESLSIAMKGYKSFQKYVSGLKFLKSKNYNPKPEIKIQIPEKRKDLNIPKLDRFNKDNRIIIKPVKSANQKYFIRAEALYPSFKLQLTTEHYEPSIIKTRRIYDIDIIKINKSRMEILEIVERFPIVFNCNIRSYLSLAYEIILEQLEPFTSRAIFKDIVKQRIKNEKEFMKLEKQRRYEEELLGNALIRRWSLLEVKNLGIDADTALRIIPDNFPSEHTEKSLWQIIKKGPEDSLKFYASKEWNLKDFLEGRY